MVESRKQDAVAKSEPRLFLAVAGERVLDGLGSASNGLLSLAEEVGALRSSQSGVRLIV